jgi:hypothetical protein
MFVSRRRFLQGASALVSGAALLPAEGLAAIARGHHYTRVVPLSATDQSVLAWVRGYATNVRLAGASVLGKLRKSKRLRTHIIADIPSGDALQAALSGVLPFGPISLYTSGNTVSFTLDGTDFTIDNLLTDDFTAALTALLTRAGVTFATDGLTWDPTTNDLSDPFGALAAVLKLVNPGVGLQAVFDTVLKSWDEANIANVGFDVSFRAYRQRIFNLRSARSPLATDLGQQFAEELPGLTDLLTTGQLALVLGTPLIAGALLKAFGVRIGPLLAEFKLLRELNGTDLSDAGILLSQLLQQQIDLGTADGLGSGLDRFNQLRFRAALGEARRVKKIS